MTNNCPDGSVQSNIEPSLRELSEASNEHKRWQNFLFAFLLGALLSFVGLSISMEMTHTVRTDVSWLQWMGAIALPFLPGFLAVIFKKPFMNALGALMQVLPY